MAKHIDTEPLVGSFLCHRLWPPYLKAPNDDSLKFFHTSSRPYLLAHHLLVHSPHTLSLQPSPNKNIKSILLKLEQQPHTIEFQEVIDVVDSYYTFIPTSFANGDIHNDAGTNSGSCKIFSFGALHNLSKESTLACFGSFYLNDVLNHPESNDHGNIRNFMKTGWGGIEFSAAALTPK